MDPCVFKQLYWITPLNCALIVRINTYTVKSYLSQRRFVLCLLVFFKDTRLFEWVCRETGELC